MKDVKEMTDVELEEAWQLSTNRIAKLLKVYYAYGDETDREDSIKEQSKQTLIQEEITRRTR